MGHIEASKDLAAAPTRSGRPSPTRTPGTSGSPSTSGGSRSRRPLSPQGAKLTAKIVMLGMANKIEWTVESVDAPHSLVLTGTGMAGVKARFTFTIAPEGNGFAVHGRPATSKGPDQGRAGKAVEKDGMKQLDKSLEQLDALASAPA